MARFGVGIVGIGGYAGAIASDIAATEGMSLVSCFTRTPEKRKAFAEKWHCREAASYEEMLADPEVKAVCVVSPNHVHAEQGIAAAAARKHVFVEKPIAHEVADAGKLVRACEKAGVVLMVGHNDRRDPPHRAVKRLLAEGTIGKPIFAEANHSGYGFHGYALGDWRRDPANCFGPMCQLGIHKIDTLRFLLGDVARAAGVSGKYTFTDSAVDDSMGAFLEFESGCTGFVGSSFTAWGNFFSLQGTKAVVRSIGGWSSEWPEGYREEGRPPIWMMTQADTRDAGWRRIPRAPEAAREGQMAEFLRCIQNGTKPEVDGREGLKTLAVAHAIRRAATERRWVEVAEVLREAD